jgi:hypothetical protein
MISAEQLAKVGAATRQDARVAALRPLFPELHFTECSEDDVSPRYQPALSLDQHELYLISGSSGHCLALTNSLEAATGILVAAKVDDE